jgi:hypothetical protein
MLIFYGEGVLATPQPPSRRTIPCRLSAAAYLMYSQLPCIAGGRPSIRNPTMRHAVVTRAPPNRRMRWAGNIAQMGEKRNAYRSLTEKPKGKRP